MAKFQDIFTDKTSQGHKLQTSEYLKSGKYPIIDQGKEQIAGYTNSEDGIFFDVPAIIFGDHTRIIKYVDEPFFLGADGVKVLKCKMPDVDYKYLYYYLQNVHIPNTGYNRHFKWLKEAEFYIHPFDEQRKIAAVLDKISDLIAKRRRQLDKLDELVQSRFVEMFGDLRTNPKGWSIKTFDEFAKIDGNMTTDYAKYANYPHIGIDSIEKITGELKGYRTVREDGVISGKYVFTPKHIIYSKIRPNLNKVALPNFEGLCSADAYPILPNENNCERIFLALAMRSEYFLDYILQFSSRTNLPKVNRKEIAGFCLPLPPLELQKQFSAFFYKSDKIKAAIRKNLEKLEMLKKALMQEYFLVR